MEYRVLGNTGLWVSEIGLGGNTFGRYCDESQTAAVIHRALELGVNHFDTAELYSQGVSEQYVGKALAGQWDNVVIATKVGWGGDGRPNAGGASYRRVLAGCEGSLRRLGTDHIDLYYLHQQDPVTPMEETFRAFDDLVRQGKIRYVGISNHPAWRICDALWICDRRGYRSPAVTQDSYSMMDRGVETELLPFCRAHGISLVPYAPLFGGILTGKYRPGEPIPPGTRGYDQERIRQRLTERNFALLGRLEAFARAQGHTISELAIAWLLSHPEVCSVIAGATRPEQVEVNASAGRWKLSPDEVQATEAILSQMPPTAPGSS